MTALRIMIKYAPIQYGERIDGSLGSYVDNRLAVIGWAL